MDVQVVTLGKGAKEIGEQIAKQTGCPVEHIETQRDVFQFENNNNKPLDREKVKEELSKHLNELKLV